MALSVANLFYFPAINFANDGGGHTPGFTGQRGVSGTITDYPTYTFTNGVYTPGSTTYVAGILDQQGVNPSRIFFSDNGSGQSGTETVLPTLVSITQVNASGQSLQELASNYSNSVSFNEYVAATGYSGFQLILNAASGTADDGMYPLGYNNAINSGPAFYANVPGWVSQGGAYTGTTTTGYPNPQMRFFVTMNALLVIASTNVG